MDSIKYPALCAPKDGYVFVITYGRSGSTLTQRLLNAIPGYCIRGENGNLTYFLSRAIHLVTQHDMYTWRREDLNKKPKDRRNYLKNIVGEDFDPWAGAENVDPDDFRLSLMDVFAKTVLQPPADCRVSGFKEIRLHEDAKFFNSHLTYLRDSFPNARFIFQTRDHHKVSSSSWWANQSKAKVMNVLHNAETMFAEFSQQNPNISFTLRYESFAEGASYVQQLYQFLGEDVSNEDIDKILNEKLQH